jgi:hypothetical protein
MGHLGPKTNILEIGLTGFYGVIYVNFKYGAPGVKN